MFADTFCYLALANRLDPANLRAARYATSFAVMERDSVATARTGDHHFTQAGFAALLV